MTRLTLAAAVAAFFLAAGPAAAQQAGGVVPGGGGGMDPSMMGMGMGAAGLGGRAVISGPPPTRTPVPVASVNPARSRQAANQAAIAKIRGDAGFLAGFQQGVPLAASRQPPPPAFEAAPDFVFIDASATFNNFQSVVNLDLLQQGVAEPEAADGQPQAQGQGQGQPQVQPQGQADGKGKQTTKRGRAKVEINNAEGSIVAVDSVVNAAVGNGNVAQQVIRSGR